MTSVITPVDTKVLLLLGEGERMKGGDSVLSFVTGLGLSFKPEYSHFLVV